MTFPEIKRMAAIIIFGGAKNIHLTGGEPLLRPDFAKIINLFSSHKLKIFLDTNADFFAKYKNIISSKISVLGLPIDFPDKSWRNDKNLENIKKVLLYYKKKKDKKPKIQILTTVTKENINQLEKIGLLLKNYPIDVWRIFQFLPLKGTNACKNKKKLWISKKQFLAQGKKIKKRFSNYFNISLINIGTRNHAYFIIGSDGEVAIPTESKKICENKIVGSIFEDDILEKWKRFGSILNFNKSSKEILDLIE